MRPLREEGRGQVTRHLGHGDGVLVFDPSGWPTAGRESVGVARQWCGRRGKVDTCPVAISRGSVSRKGHSLVDTRRYLRKAWTKDTARLDNAGVPHASRAYRTRHPLALAMLAQHGAALPPRWMAGDDERGRPAWCRRRLAAWDTRALLAVPSHPARRDLETPLGELARVAKAAHRIEECLQRRKRAAGLADYEGRHWPGWPPPPTLSCRATWFLVGETQRGKKMDHCAHLPADSPRHRGDRARDVAVRDDVAYAERAPEALATQ